MTQFPGRRALAAMVFAALAALLHLTTASATPAPHDCRGISMPVALTRSSPAEYQVYGQLCRPFDAADHTVQVLVPGITYDHTYWNVPDGMTGNHSSYVDAANYAGMATLALDRIGVGHSSRPPGLDVTLDSNSYVLHQVVQDLRHGNAGLPRFTKIALVGHSFGSWTSWYEMDRYHDVDAAVYSGAVHGANPLGAAQVVGSVYPATLDPALHGSVPDPTYLTTIPGQRNFLHEPGWVDPRLLRYDEAHKQTTTVGEMYNFPLVLLHNLHIHAPVLLAIGSDDPLFCGGPVAPNCSSATDVANFERPHLDAPSVDAFVLPGAGHDLNYAPNAGLWYTAAQRWIVDHTR